jgi:alanyl-tRNA synthetase
LEEKSSEWGVNYYKNTAIWFAWKILIFWWDFPSDSKLTTTNIYKSRTKQQRVGPIIGRRVSKPLISTKY